MFTNARESSLFALHMKNVQIWPIKYSSKRRLNIKLVEYAWQSTHLLHACSNIKNRCFQVGVFQIYYTRVVNARLAAQKGGISADFGLGVSNLALSFFAFYSLRLDSRFGVGSTAHLALDSLFLDLCITFIRKRLFPCGLADHRAFVSCCPRGMCDCSLPSFWLSYRFQPEIHSKCVFLLAQNPEISIFAQDPSQDGCSAY